MTTSIEWYDANAATFFANSAHVRDLPQRVRFQTWLPMRGSVLDAGCGSGRDAFAFAEAGYRVTAFDGSAEMVRLARGHTGLDVLQMTFAELAGTEVFDGVWACASLLHVTRDELPAVLARVRRALKPGGVFFASFKLGPGERWVNGRRFTDFEPEPLKTVLAQAGFELLLAEITDDLRPDREGERWTSATARRPLVDARPSA
ncbi:MAG TPA: class I SAM-dependent methyltransferase [Caulobacteraceae bacterium]|nr:class I SAM-dependent methyltransferase [Caulobacteraceae bacterium]